MSFFIVMVFVGEWEVFFFYKFYILSNVICKEKIEGYCYFIIY